MVMMLLDDAGDVAGGDDDVCDDDVDGVTLLKVIRLLLGAVRLSCCLLPSLLIKCT